MLVKNKIRAVYSRTVHGNVIAIIDHDGSRSVTNDADNVIADLAAQGFDLALSRDLQGYPRHLGSIAGRPHRPFRRFQQH